MRIGVVGVNAYSSRSDRSTASFQRSFSAKCSSIFDERLVWIAVQPMFARLRRCDHWVATGVGVFAGVLIRGTVAAQRDSTGLARPEMHPIGTDLYAFFAFATMRLLDRLNGDSIQMGTASDTHIEIAFTLDSLDVLRRDARLI
jgi:hypothetical protein